MTFYMDLPKEHQFHGPYGLFFHLMEWPPIQGGQEEPHFPGFLQTRNDRMIQEAFSAQTIGLQYTKQLSDFT